MKDHAHFPILLSLTLTALSAAACASGPAPQPPTVDPSSTSALYATEALATASFAQTEASPTTSEAALAPPAAPAVMYVDDFGADPCDESPDSEAIQEALDNLPDGYSLLFTGFGGRVGCVGYLIDKTLFIVTHDPKRDITLGSTDPKDPALLSATEDLLGFVIQLYSRARYRGSLGQLDNIVLQALQVDGGRDARACVGPDQSADGVDDNWGSWVPGECTMVDDPWCNAGGIALSGGIDPTDVDQDFASAPSVWSTGFEVSNLTIRNVECGTALGFTGAASSIINNTIDTAGEHTHIAGCNTTDPDGELAMWADGITFDGSDILVENNTVINASDIGIVFFGGRDVRINHNTVISEAGNYGAFAGIAVHTWGLGDISGLELIGNSVSSVSDTRCGGLHAGINIGTHMWGGGCRLAGAGNIGSPNVCEDEPQPPQGQSCVLNQPCQIWAHVAPNGRLTLADNQVTGAHINYLIEGLDQNGSLDIGDNKSLDPQETDWDAAALGCGDQTHKTTWGPLDFVAHHPTLPGWTDQIVHCER